MRNMTGLLRWGYIMRLRMIVTIGRLLGVWEMLGLRRPRIIPCKQKKVLGK